MTDPSRSRRLQKFGLLAVTAVALAGLGAAAAPPPVEPVPAAPARPATEADITFFEAKVRPLFLKQCVACHSSKVAQGGLRLDDPAAMLKGGDRGVLVTPGEPDKSLLLHAVRFTQADLKMPPAGKMSDADLSVLEEWVRRGAPVPRPAAAGAKPGKRGPMTVAEGKGFWSIRPLRRVPPPALRARKPLPGGNRIDAYLEARLESAKLTPAPTANRGVLIRRAYFDLVGLPPTPEEVDAFVRDPDPKAYERLIDRLLASPHYGERWGRHWLDMARYCDIPEVWAKTDASPWLYRDWVVRALNEDLPYNQFVGRQLAADQMPGLPPTEIAALGFIGLSPSYWKELKLAPDVIKTVVAEEWEERIDALSQTVLGLTAACARCHDHKFDPISTRDYYALAGIFASIRQTPRPLLPAEMASRVTAAREQVAKLETEATKFETDAAQKVDGKPVPQSEEMRKRAIEIRARMASIRAETPHYDAPLAYAVEEASLIVGPDGPDRTRLDYRMGEAQNVAVQLRGNPAKPGNVEPRHFLTVLSPNQPAPFTAGSGRRELAEAMFRDSAPLVSRVLVNRVWKHHFGMGLVETPSNFGSLGERPTHPELLDDLAARFIEAGWSLKWLHREIMLSNAYRRSHRGSAQLTAIDPDNRLLGRMSRQRLEVEPWRDAILTASGSLDSRTGGAPEELSSAKNVRRTLYGVVKRRDLDDLLRLYDFPDPVAHNPARYHTTTPLQQLYLLNSEFIHRQATALAARVQRERPGEPLRQVQRAYYLLYGRPASPAELQAAQKFLGISEANTAPTAEAWQEFAEVLLASNRLMFVD